MGYYASSLYGIPDERGTRSERCSRCRIEISEQLRSTRRDREEVSCTHRCICGNDINVIERLVVLRTLQKVTLEFVKTLSKKKGLPQTIINEAGGKIFTFGSYRLGVFGPGMSQSILAAQAATKLSFL